MLRIATTHTSNRFTYITRMLFEHYLNVPVKLVFPGEDAHVYYGCPAKNRGISIPVNGFLSPGEIAYDTWKSEMTKAREWLENPTPELSFDLLGLSFSLMARVQEFQEKHSDAHNRFPAEKSWLFPHAWLETPWVNSWLHALQLILQTRFPELGIRTPSFHLVSTIDIDNGYDFRGKPLFRTAAGLLKDAARGNVQRVFQRIRVLCGKAKDPFDVYDELIRFHMEIDVPLRFFILGAMQRTKWDGNISVRSAAFSRLVRQLPDIGLHPSYRSSDEPAVLQAELRNLSEVLNRPVTHTRQHFLRFENPAFYPELEKSGVAHDWSMGFAGAPGFRAGCAFPFRWYNLETEAETTLWIHPITCMEGTFRDYLHISPEEALQRMLALKETIQQVGGEMVTLWHEKQIAESPWKNVYFDFYQTRAV